MPDNKKGKFEPKEQRKPRQKQAIDKKNEKCLEKTDQKAPVKPEYVEPGPEFYQNLKRETDDIIKITQESNAKYSKKEIQSNWTKYDIPIPTYENIDQEESIGEDYEKIIQMPMSTGGHFQFKHEKSWNIVTTPSEYDKYFDVDPENVALAMSSIPFYERNDINIELFTEYDLNNMRNRASKYKEKYENSKLCYSKETIPVTSNIDVVENKETKKENIFIVEEEKYKETDSEMLIETAPDKSFEGTNDKIDALNLNKNHKNEHNDIQLDIQDTTLTDNKIQKEVIEEVIEKIKTTDIKQNSQAKIEVSEVKTEALAAATNKPNMKSPEDLEKWLDDFLDG